MQTYHKFLLLSILALGTSVAGQASTRQACPAHEVSVFESCICPTGTEFQITTTYATLGVSAKDFYKYTSSFFDVSWQGIPSVIRNGPDYTPGSTRTYSGPTAVGNLTITEKLDSFQSNPDGSFLARWSQFNVPLEYTTSQGSFSGFWQTLDAQRAAKYETALKWEVYACFVGHPFNFGKGHNLHINGVLDKMRTAGLVKGNTTGPYYVQNW